MNVACSLTITSVKFSFYLFVDDGHIFWCFLGGSFPIVFTHSSVV